MSKKKNNTYKSSGDPRKRAAAAREKQVKNGLDQVLDEFLSTEVAEKSAMLAEDFLSSRSGLSTSKEMASIKRFFLLVAVGASAMAVTKREGKVNLERMAAYSGISNKLLIEIECWLEEKELITVS